MDIRGRKMRKPPACVQCRRRKIGCDRVKPVCGNCNKSGKYDCFFPDVPGMYTPSVSNYERKTTPKVSKAQVAMDHHVRESLLHKNDQHMGLKALEQMRDYNTRLQLLNAQSGMFESSANGNEYSGMGGDNESNPYIPAGYEDYQLLMSYYGTPAEFDLMKSRYSQEEILLKEMEFLEEKLVEVSDLYKENEELDKLNEDIKRQRNKKKSTSITTNNDELIFKKLKEQSKRQAARVPTDDSDMNTSDIGDDAHSNCNETTEFSEDNVDKFKVIDPNFINKQEIFAIGNNVCVKSGVNDVLPLFDNRNKVFDKQFLIYRDRHLARFYNTLHNLNKTHFTKEFKLWEDVRSMKSFLEKNVTTIRLPERALMQEMIIKYTELVQVSGSMIPVLKSKNELLSSIEQLFSTATQFILMEQSIENLLALFNINMCLLLTFESLSSTVLIPLKEEELKNYQELKNWVPTLKANMEYMKTELESRKNYESIEVLKVISLYKFYRMISSNYNNMVDYDEDIYLARKLALNYESKNAEAIILWNFIFKNYCLRHLFGGETPNLVSGPELNSSIVIDPLLANNIPLLSFQMDIVAYLHSKDFLISMEKLKKFKQTYKFKLNDANKRGTDTASTLQNVIDSTIYRNSVLLLDNYMLIQYESLGEVDLFEDILNEFLKLTQESLFYAFSNLATLKFAGFEFLFANFSFNLLDNICHMLLSLHQRTAVACNIINDSTDATKKVLLQTLMNTLKDVLSKLMMLLDDYKKNLKYIDQNISKILSKMKVIIEYLENKDSIKNRDQDQFIDVLSQIADNKLEQINTKMISISESLIKTDFYSKRDKYEKVDSITLGITPGNYSNVFSAFFP
ncbi:hypothetical protein TPHA_0E01290 [Tetrapisispora phaffii CBS 4417]|uniref:Zn(2)-C6 fungal-type domain-containing protein n=1 Tax=Tetrapisispora phaffii (strain ATCC 24235 / CBS 4417 / NBRC 1672 / NRRL Y-8282 / UCD 70-5) TaxID=1071381 RepID=G8BTJ6_TETPH|nr:hypothetical protein TPHA_0E01290 [Tetrapisispora phaffii CBS 4417]CCE63224.1 hypothetical protein TPHA_0E01290 [Tetrapisispora phaffii CBS 4417]